MSKIDDRVKEAVDASSRVRENREEFERVQKFVAEARERGVVIERKYDLPLLDTIGSAAYRN